MRQDARLRFSATSFHLTLLALILAGVVYGDFDRDGLPNYLEVRIGTGIFDPDTDDDSLLDGWEVAGQVPSRWSTAGFQGPVGIPGSNPLRKDVYVEVDWMVGAHDHQFRQAAVASVQEAFTRAPVQNPSGEFGINLHVDTGQLGGGGDELEHQTLMPVGTGFNQINGFGDSGQGACVAVGQIDGSAMPDLVIMAYDNPAGANNFRYQIGWNINRDGQPTSQNGVPNMPWSGVTQVPGVGHEGQGAGCRVIDLNGNGRPELVLMAYDNPSGPNSFRYRVGFDLDTNGIAASWSGYVQVAGVGDDGQGAGLAFVNLDSNPRPEMILMAYDAPSGANNFRYRIGWNVNTSGIATSWSGYVQVDGVGHDGQGGDVDLADLDNNGRPEMVLMAYDNPSGQNSYRYRIGWNLDTAGLAQDWQQGFVTYPGTGHDGDGAGLAFINLDGGRMDMLLVSYDAPSGANNFRINIAYNLDAEGNAVHYDYFKERFFDPGRAGIYHYCIFGHDYWQGGSSSGLSWTNRDFIVTLGSWSGQTGTDQDQAGTFMHELGHNLGLGHGGNDGTNYKPNYLSVMNYSFQIPGVDVDFDGNADGPLDYSHGWLGPLNENGLNEFAGVSGFASTEGMGNEGDGADMAVADLDGNGTRDLIVLAYDAPSGANHIRYKIGFDITTQGIPRRWRNGFVALPGFGDSGQGAGVELADLDGNGRPEMIVLVYDNPSGANDLRYRIGWNLNRRGQTSNWGRTIFVPGMGHEGQGAGIALVNLDGNVRPELVVMVYDNPSGANNFRYKIGWNLDIGGNPQFWSGAVQVDGVGHEGQGAGVAFANIDRDPRPEMFLMAYDAPSGPNNFRVKLGWNINSAGFASGWTGFSMYPGLGHEGQGAGIRVLDLDGTGRPDMLLMAYDNPSGPNTFRFIRSLNLNSDGTASGGFLFPRDWNGNGTLEGNVSVNINGDTDNNGNAIVGVLNDWNDWQNLVL